MLNWLPPQAVAAISLCYRTMAWQQRLLHTLYSTLMAMSHAAANRLSRRACSPPGKHEGVGSAWAEGAAMAAARRRRRKEEEKEGIRRDDGVV